MANLRPSTAAAPSSPAHSPRRASTTAAAEIAAKAAAKDQDGINTMNGSTKGSKKELRKITNLYSTLPSDLTKERKSSLKDTEGGLRKRVQEIEKAVEEEKRRAQNQHVPPGRKATTLRQEAPSTNHTKTPSSSGLPQPNNTNPNGPSGVILLVGGYGEDAIRKKKAPGDPPSAPTSGKNQSLSTSISHDRSYAAEKDLSSSARSADPLSTSSPTTSPRSDKSRQGIDAKVSGSVSRPVPQPNVTPIPTVPKASSISPRAITVKSLNGSQQLPTSTSSELNRSRSEKRDKKERKEKKEKRDKRDKREKKEKKEKKERDPVQTQSHPPPAPLVVASVPAVGAVGQPAHKTNSGLLGRPGRSGSTSPSPAILVSGPERPVPRPAPATLSGPLNNVAALNNIPAAQHQRAPEPQKSPSRPVPPPKPNAARLAEAFSTTMRSTAASSDVSSSATSSTAHLPIAVKPLDHEDLPPPPPSIKAPTGIVTASAATITSSSTSTSATSKPSTASVPSKPAAPSSTSANGSTSPKPYFKNLAKKAPAPSSASSPSLITANSTPPSRATVALTPVAAANPQVSTPHSTSATVSSPPSSAVSSSTAVPATAPATTAAASLRSDGVSSSGSTISRTEDTGSRISGAAGTPANSGSAASSTAGSRIVTSSSLAGSRIGSGGSQLGQRQATAESSIRSMSPLPATAVGIPVTQSAPVSHLQSLAAQPIAAVRNLELPSLNTELNDRAAASILYRTTLRAWVNYRLLKRGNKISSIREDLRDGIALCQLTEALTGKRIAPPSRSSGIRMTDEQCRANIQTALWPLSSYLTQNGMHLEDAMNAFVSEDTAGIVRVLSLLAIRVDLQAVSADLSHEQICEKLIRWARERTGSYRNVLITNLDSSWESGLAFCALVHSYSPTTFDYKTLVETDPRSNFQRAFTIAEQTHSVPRLLDVNFLVGSRLDASSVLLYLGFLYQGFESPLAPLAEVSSVLSGARANTTAPMVASPSLTSGSPFGSPATSSISVAMAAGTPTNQSPAVARSYFSPGRGHQSMIVTTTSSSSGQLGGIPASVSRDGSPFSRSSGRPLASLSAAELARELLEDTEADIRQLQQSQRSPAHLGGAASRNDLTLSNSQPLSLSSLNLATTPAVQASTSANLASSVAGSRTARPANPRLQELRGGPGTLPTPPRQRSVQFADNVPLSASPSGSRLDRPLAGDGRGVSSNVPNSPAAQQDEDYAQRVLNRLSLPQREPPSVQQQIADTREILAIQPNNVAMLLRLGQLLRQGKQPMGALDALNQAVVLDSINLGVRLELAKVFYDLGKVNDAVRELDLARTIDPINAEVPLVRGHCAFKLGQYTQSLEHYEQALQLAGPNADIPLLLSLSRALISLGRQSEALPHLVKAIKIEPTRHAYTLLGSALQGLGRADKAVEMYQRALECVGNKPADACHLNLATAYFRLEQYDKAKSHYEQAVSLYPEEAWYGIARVYYAQKNLDMTREAFEKVLETNPKHVNARLQLAVIMQMLGDVSEAKFQYEQVLVLDPKHAIANAKLGEIWEKTRPAKALEYYRAALAQTPNDPRVLRLLGHLHMKMNQTAEAMKYLELSIRLQPTPECRNWIGECHYQSQQYDKALECFNDALRDAPNYVEALLNLGDTHFKLRDLIAAKNCYQKVLQIDPQNISAEFKLKDPEFAAALSRVNS